MAIRPITRQDWIDAGHAGRPINREMLEQTLGKFIPASVDCWEKFCQWTYKVLTGAPLADCSLRGTGFVSQWYGEQVAKVWPEPEPIDISQLTKEQLDEYQKETGHRLFCGGHDERLTRGSKIMDTDGEEYILDDIHVTGGWRPRPDTEIILSKLRGEVTYSRQPYDAMALYHNFQVMAMGVKVTIEIHKLTADCWHVSIKPAENEGLAQEVIRRLNLKFEMIASDRKGVEALLQSAFTDQGDVEKVLLLTTPEQGRIALREYWNWLRAMPI